MPNPRETPLVPHPCGFEHHDKGASKGKIVPCPKCGGVTVCGPFVHAACPTCTPSQFNSCGMCHRPMYDCTC